MPRNDMKQGDCFVPRNDGKSHTGTTFIVMKELTLIRHCEKTPVEDVFIMQEVLKGFSWQSFKARLKGDC